MSFTKGGQWKTRIKDGQQEEEAESEMIESLNGSQRSRRGEKGECENDDQGQMDGGRGHMRGLCLPLPSAHETCFLRGGWLNATSLSQLQLDPH